MGLLTWAYRGPGEAVLHSAAACRSCVCEDSKTGGGCCRQDRRRAGRRKRAELLDLRWPCFARTGPWLQAGKWHSILRTNKVKPLSGSLPHFEGTTDTYVLAVLRGTDRQNTHLRCPAQTGHSASLTEAPIAEAQERVVGDQKLGNIDVRSR
jgi:hypothetical protein